MSASLPLPVFSVVIPTLQRSPDLRTLIEQCAANPLVLEVLIINNSTDPLTSESSKVRVIQQDENIYVNPAWNLGAGEARGQYLAIINDDVRFDDEIFEYARKLLRRGTFGMVGIDGSIINKGGPRRITHRLATYEHVAIGFGMFMALRRENYVTIPDEMKIWGGDDYLFLSQKRPNAVIRGTRFETDISVTSSSPEFQLMRLDELEKTNRNLGPIHGSRWWHAPSSYLASIRRKRAQLKNRMAKSKRFRLEEG
ncbi:glycosyltransferase family 2 protein [Neomicrococcus lactis]|uniref:Glycosyltransferase involved in cell wall biosynthesis n=1 Tax=Neomicrococcus lactis TaxID=732241 RepID=A0A7W9DAZ9_9MICC|nr:glycosyltransferase [Neomicrococcus lactis]MBB5598175.1 glycosyltransferase involved in cell wall biosynthesis [Neomicrococcus lactis]